MIPLPGRLDPNDLFHTDPRAVKSAFKLLDLWTTQKYGSPFQPKTILDVGSGESAIWAIKALDHYDHIPELAVDTIEIRGGFPSPDTRIRNFMTHTNFVPFSEKIHADGLTYDLTMGNPPYGMSEGKRDKKLAENIVRGSINITSTKGYTYMLLKSVFTEGIGRGHGLFTELPPIAIFQSMRRIPFRPEEYGNSTNDIAYSMFLWKKDVRVRTEQYWWDWLDGEVVLI